MAKKKPQEEILIRIRGLINDMQTINRECFADALVQEKLNYYYDRIYGILNCVEMTVEKEYNNRRKVE